MTPAGLARYQEVDVLTMSPSHRVLLMYGQLVLNLRQARAALEAKDIAGRSVRVAKALEIFNMLLFSLDRDQGGALADQLAALYVYLINETTKADRDQDGARLDRVITLATSLQQAWIAAAETTG